MPPAAAGQPLSPPLPTTARRHRHHPAQPAHCSAPAASDPSTCPLAAGARRLSSLSGCSASASAATGPHSACSGAGVPVAAALPQPLPVPLASTQVTFMPLAHQGSKWAPAPPPRRGSSVAAIAAVPILSRSTAAALVGRGAPPAECHASSGSAPDDSVAGGTASPRLPTQHYRPWTGVQRLMQAVGQQAGGSGRRSEPDSQPAAGLPAAGPRGSADSTSTAPLPWDRRSAHAAAEPRLATVAAARQRGPAADPPPHVPASRPLPTGPAPAPAAQAWRGAAAADDAFSPLFSSAAAQLLAQQHLAGGGGGGSSGGQAWAARRR